MLRKADEASALNGGFASRTADLRSWAGLFHHPTGRRGQALISFAVVIPLVLIPVTAYAVEASYLATRQAALAEVAAQVAEDAVQQIDEATLRASGPLQVDPLKARAAVDASLGAREPSAVVRSFTAGGRSVSLVLAETVPVQLAFWAPGGAVTISAAASARLTAGYSGPLAGVPAPSPRD